MSDLSFISFPLPSYKIDIDWPNKRSFHSQSFLFKLNSYVQMTSDDIFQETRNSLISIQYGVQMGLCIIWPVLDSSEWEMMDEAMVWRLCFVVWVRYGTVTCALDIWSWYAELCYYSIYIMFHPSGTLSLKRINECENKDFMVKHTKRNQTN